MFRGTPGIAAQTIEMAGTQQLSPIERSPKSDGLLQQVRDFLGAYLRRRSAPVEESEQQQMDRTTDMLRLIFSGANQPESAGGKPIPCLIDQLIDVTTAVVERHLQPEPVSADARRVPELPAWIAPAPVASSAPVGRDR
jgi:hypothetical protein